MTTHRARHWRAHQEEYMRSMSLCSLEDEPRPCQKIATLCAIVLSWWVNQEVCGGDGSEGDDAIRGVVDQVSSIPGELVVATPVDVFVARE
jgi:hypothetical protein